MFASPMSRRRIFVWSIAAAVAFAALAVIVVREEHWRPGSITIEGAVIRHDTDNRQELPIAGATVTAWDGVTSSTTQSDAAGYFKLTFHERVWPDEVANLSFRHPDFQPLDINLQIGLRSDRRKLYVAALEPKERPVEFDGRLAVISNIRIRYTVNFQSEENVGAAIKTFQVVNKGNVPCRHQEPCSPSGVWKAAAESATLDAGPGNEFRNVRASCFAGPCPFTRIDSSGFAHGGRIITASALNWSDTATFLLEAEVFHRATGSSVRESYPVIYGRVLHFTVPPNQEGVSIEAEIDGTPMVFPLGPDLYLSWAKCSSRSEPGGEASTALQCELKPGYRF
jgi:hypothetical protein